MATKEQYATATERALANIGRRCHWVSYPQQPGGEIVGVIKNDGGWPAYIVKWDRGAPLSWSEEVSAAHGPNFVIED